MRTESFCWEMYHHHTSTSLKSALVSVSGRRRIKKCSTPALNFDFVKDDNALNKKEFRFDISSVEKVLQHLTIVAGDKPNMD